MNMAINMHEYGRGEKCVYMFKYTYAGIREMKIQMEEKDRYTGKAMSISIGTVT